MHLFVIYSYFKTVLQFMTHFTVEIIDIILNDTAYSLKYVYFNKHKYELVCPYSLYSSSEC